MTPIEIIYGLAIIIASGILAYLYKRYTELARLFLEEKVAVLERAIPILDKVAPIVPDPYKQQVAELLDFLKIWKSINDAILSTPPRKAYKTWLQLKTRLK